ncbi:MAG: metal-sulfur cluster assembly factor [Pseudomonadota bacterium]|jgi:metal-sulfur cluster biosynthetic enzyme|nr:metal-sulfur cluster assembly factor [Pseudomonadota bacterium]
MNSGEREFPVEHARQALRTVIDPELGYNIVDLGLIYDVSIDDAGVAHVLMTTTTRGCPATGYLQEGARESVARLPGIAGVDVVMTYDPEWSPQMMTSEAKRHLGIEEESIP